MRADDFGFALRMFRILETHAPIFPLAASVADLHPEAACACDDLYKVSWGRPSCNHWSAQGERAWCLANSNLKLPGVASRHRFH